MIPGCSTGMVDFHPVSKCGMSGYKRGIGHALTTVRPFDRENKSFGEILSCTFATSLRISGLVFYHVKLKPAYTTSLKQSVRVISSAHLLQESQTIFPIAFK